MDKISKIKELIDQLSLTCKAYYVDDKPIMTDKEYDALYDELYSLEQETNYIQSNSPTQKVQGEVLPFLKKVTHTEPMLSAEKSKEINDVVKFIGGQECVLSWKLDGLTLVLRYNNGKLQQAITRGGGTDGEDVTHTVKHFTNVPLTIDYDGYLEIRGEGLVTFNEFEKINAELIAKGEETYSSPRNLAAGSVRQLDANVAKQRNLIFIAFGIVKCDISFKEKCQQFKFLSDLGFDVVEYMVIDKSIVKECVDGFKEKLSTLPYLTDGLIIEYNNISYGKAQGSTGHHTKNMFALKWQDNSSETVFRGVELNTTRTGMVSITALFDEVLIDGVKVSRASLHNYDIFEELELGAEDTISVYRANAVIPQVEENLTRSGTYKIDMKCPSCGEGIVIKRPKEARFLYCENENCPSKLVNKFTHFVSKNAMNIDGLSEATIEKFIEEGFLKSFDSIYNLEQYKSKIIGLDGFGKKSYEKLIQAIEKSRKVRCANFIYALGIPQIGVSSSKTIAKYFNDDIQAFLKACNDEFDFSRLDDFGDITNRSIHKWYRDVGESHLWIYLIDEIEIIKEEKKAVSEGGVFQDMKIYCTGTFASHKKEELKNIVETQGGEFASGYAKTLDYLVVGSLKGSSKEDKARKDGVKILTEGEFLEMIGES